MKNLSILHDWHLSLTEDAGINPYKLCSDLKGGIYLFLIIYFALLGSVFHFLFIRPAAIKKVDKQPFFQQLDPPPSSVLTEAKSHAR